jgi:hypothetical protein
VHQVVHNLFVRPRRVRFELIARGAEAGAPQQMRHQRQTLVRHFSSSSPADDGRIADPYRMVGDRPERYLSQV